MFGWFAATVVFVGVVRLIGGPNEGDLGESAYSTWAIAHGYLSCAYAPATTSHIPSIAYPGPFIAPLWPLLSGGLAALLSIGHHVPFPSRGTLGPHCSNALTAIYKWSVRSNAAATTTRLAYLSWPVFVGGVVAVLRACGRGRCGWEPATLLFLACTPPIWMATTQYFHPQDVVAMGLVLAGVACARRGAWMWAGALMGLAVTSQQFALLVVALLAVIAPAKHRIRYLGATIGAALLVLVPVIIASSGRAIRSVFLGSGNSASLGGTILWELHLHGSLLVIASRIVPIVISMALAAWAVRRLGARVFEPLPLLSLVASSLSLRLVFEQNLFGYYFMALAAALVLLDVVGGRLRGRLLAWLALCALAFSPVPWGFVTNSVTWGLQEREFLPFVFGAIVLVFIVHDARRARVRAYLVAWLVVVGVAFGRLPWENPPLRHSFPVWFWQVVLVGTGVALAIGPLLSSAKDHTEPTPLRELTVGVA